jgi:uncharacterized protein
MPQLLEIVLLPSERHDEAVLRRKVLAQSGLRPTDLQHIEVLKASLDARSRQVVYRLRVEVYSTQEVYQPEAPLLKGYQPVRDNAPRALIIGAGPAGYFAALELIELGIRPIVLDRGKDVRARRRDLRAIQQFGVVDPHSNYCFGEGGAGTYSDGKLYTRSVKRGNVIKSLRLLVEHGAKSDILVEAHPHIGSNKLPEVVQNIRESIVQYGGEVHFGQFVTEFILNDKREMCGVRTAQGQEWLADAVIVATGHSARDIYRQLDAQGVRLEAKPFALGLRIEHPQPLIDRIQYHREVRDEDLPAASYSLVCQINEKGVFSFCMCPGGLIVPAATAPGEVVVNGMSMSRRDSPFANSGMVTAIEAEDLGPFAKHGVFGFMEFQAAVERKMFEAGDGSQRGPALRLPDFIDGRLSADLPKTSYIPGIYAAPLYDLLPGHISQRLRKGLAQFGKTMRGYYTREAIVVGTESRTSAPVRIPRDPQTFMHPETPGLFPCGEGAGYAGGIISAAMDGQNVARALAARVQHGV